MSLHYRQQGLAIILFGNTYAFRDRIKALGGKFHGPEKTWRLPMSPEALTEVAALCAEAGGGPLGDGTRSVLAGDAALGRFAPGDGASGAVALDVPSRGSPVASDPDSLTIRQLMERVSGAVSAAFPAAVWVTGEIQNLSQRASGVFFDLADARDGGHANSTMTVRSIIWSSALQGIAARRGAERIADILADGMQVRCRCQVQLYKDRGSITLVIDDLDPAFTKGALALAREKLLKELRAKGLDGANRKLALPPFPFRVGLISAAGSRARSDFLDQLAGAGFPGEVLFCAAAMQGEAVPEQVVKALARLVAAGCDLIVLTRGGGSAADLRWFDAAEIAYAIAGCPVPVIAAIGHHDDVCVAEEVCHLRQKTPTAAADFVAGVFVRTREAVETLASTLARSLARRVEELSLAAATLGARLSAAAMGAVTERDGRLLQKAQTLDSKARAWLAESDGRLRQRAASLQRGAEARMADYEARLGTATVAVGTTAERGLSERLVRLGTLETGLASHNPKPWLTAGWTRLAGPRGPVRRVAEAKVGDDVRIRLLDGWLKLRVISREGRAATTSQEPEDSP
jgi:exodeoxyribonuclease VII large subunit